MRRMESLNEDVVDDLNAVIIRLPDLDTDALEGMEETEIHAVIKQHADAVKEVERRNADMIFDHVLAMRKMEETVPDPPQPLPPSPSDVISLPSMDSDLPRCTELVST